MSPHRNGRTAPTATSPPSGLRKRETISPQEDDALVSSRETHTQWKLCRYHGPQNSRSRYLVNHNRLHPNPEQFQISTPELCVRDVRKCWPYTPISTDKAGVVQWVACSLYSPYLPRKSAILIQGAHHSSRKVHLLPNSGCLQ